MYVVKNYIQKRERNISAVICMCRKIWKRLAAVGDKALAAVPRESRDTVRADIMKQVLILQV